MKKSRKKKIEPDEIEKTETPAQPETIEPKKNPAAVALGRLGGKKGGPARAKSLSKKRRAEIAKEAAVARWKGKDAE